MWRRGRGRAEEDEGAWSGEPLSIEPIGVVRNRIRRPQRQGWEGVVSEIAVRPHLVGALDGLEGYSHIIVVFWMHRVPDEARALSHAYPAGDARYPLQGALALRTQNRPNPIGVAVVALLERQGAILRVRGLDAINGTPVLDVKPYVPYYDSVPDARVPDWVMGRAQKAQ